MSTVSMELIGSFLKRTAVSLMIAVACTRPSFMTAQEAVQWKARWIAEPDDTFAARSEIGPLDAVSPPLPIFRDEFRVSRPVSKATLRICGLGQYEAYINGHQVTKALLTPGWSDYRKRIFYDTFDVTHLVRRGQSVIGVMLGNGMYNVPATPGRYSKFTGSFGPPRLIVQLELEFVDGTHQLVVSDGSWKTTPGPIIFSAEYGGEDYDARLEKPGWNRVGYDAATWSPAAIVEGPGGKLVSETTPPIEVAKQYDAVAVTHPGAGATVYDLGQNFSGWPQIAVSGTRGTHIKLICGELLDGHGFVTQRSANASPDAPNSFSYILSGKGVEIWHPRFSYYGFRYVQVEETGYAVIHQLTGQFIHDAVHVNGSFTTSDKLFSRVHTLINQAMLSNLFSVITDCPHREKLGWLEQTYLAGPSLMYNYDLSALYAKIADDMQEAQLPGGLVPDIAPELTVFEGPFRDSPEWGLAVVLSTWTAYQFYGDVDQLRLHYDSMAAYMVYLHGKLENHILLHGLGDWYDLGPGAPGESQLTEEGLTATATYYRSLKAMERIATLVGRPQDATAYASEADRVKDAFNARFFHPDTGKYDGGSQTSEAMPLAVGLVPAESRNAVLANLIADIRSHANHVTAGDIGFHYVVRALTDSGRSDVLYDVLSRTDKPSYGNQLANGATTLTEAWDANPESSQNHLMLGHAEEWFYRGLAGIDFNLDRTPDEQIRIQPAIIGEVQHAAASFQSKLGTIQSEWTRKPDRLQIKIVIPAGATATIILPAQYSHSIRANGSPLHAGSGVRSVQTVQDRVTCIVAGGTYYFIALKS